MSHVYHICVPHSRRDYFDYESPEKDLLVGTRVWVPFRKQKKLGIVLRKNTAYDSSYALKTILSVIDEEAIIVPELLHLCLWISSYYQAPLSEVIPLALPKKYRLGEHCQLPTADFYHLRVSVEEAKNIIGSRAHKQLQLVEVLAQQAKPVAKEWLKEQGFSQTHLLTLVQRQVLVLTQEISIPTNPLRQLTPPLSLNSEQQHAVTTIEQQLDHYQCFLLEGVTGSGKTEVYLQLIAKVLARQQQVLVLVPEIGLTPQLLSRFTSRFAETMVVIHSQLNESERQVAWQLAKENRAKIVIGTRAAVFTPLPHLGLIIIDEEHDHSLKQMEGVRYSARDTALMRAHLAQIPIILGSATPSLESIYNGQQGKYSVLRLTQKALSTTPCIIN